jgi:hypothetical protein
MVYKTLKEINDNYKKAPRTGKKKEAVKFLKSYNK